MKHFLLCVCLALAGGAVALPLSQEAQAEAQLFNDFLEAAYAQRAGDPERFELLQRVLEQAPDSAYVKQQLVAEALAADQPKLAQAYIDFIESAQDDPEAWAVYGTYQWQAQQYSQALKAYEKSLELDPDNELILFEYITMLSANKPQQAEKMLMDLAAARPQLAPELYTEIGKMYTFHQQYPKALEFFDKAMALDGSNPQPRLGRAQVYEKTNQYFLMLHELEELEKMGYTTPKTLSQMASVFVLVKDLPRAKHYFLRAKEQENDNIPANYFLALIAEQEEDYNRAIAYLQDSADYTTEPAKQLQVSFYQRKLEREEDSLQTLKNAYKQFPDHNETAYFYGIALYEKEDYKQSARVLLPLLERLPDNNQVRLQYAFALEGQKKYDAMEEQLRILLEKNPRDAAALNLFAYSLALRGERLSEAADYIARALALEPENFSFMDTQAWVFFKQEQLEKAADIVSAIPEELLAANPEMAYHASYIYAALDDTQKAAHYFQMACANRPDKSCHKEAKKFF